MICLENQNSNTDAKKDVMSNCRDKCKEESFCTPPPFGSKNYPEVGMYFSYFLILFVCLLLFFCLEKWKRTCVNSLS